MLVRHYFVKATYHLRGDGPLAFIVYEEISNLWASVSREYYPNVVAGVASLASTPTQVDRLTKYAKSYVKPAYDYFEEKLTEDLAIPMSVIKEAHKFDSSRVCNVQIPFHSPISQLMCSAL